MSAAVSSASEIRGVIAAVEHCYSLATRRPENLLKSVVGSAAHWTFYTVNLYVSQIGIIQTLHEPERRL